MISKLTLRSIEIKKKSDVCVLHREQSGSTLCFSSRFLFNVRIICHFNTVNTFGYGRVQVYVDSMPVFFFRAFRGGKFPP